ncbi:MarR family winged helix-turn-helix transcriptional regulator [Gulosibacter chungangensis]|uniref:MarR family transcriptional regulator n=1 Tax=Gulosibacter chungangensis TaxID=979746 RepID=A0A7J5BBK4_9MICO|nr:MarR family transcriptional regulator [Gulosibacter chungangensis]KAB1643486.1 MarR family transcriptional regulator [Gulosibacter chungangensis]
MIHEEEPRWLNDRERGAWMRLVAVLELLPSTIDAQLRHDSGLTYTEYYALAMISETPQRRVQMKRLATLTNTTLPRLSRVISGLEKAGFVAREPNEHDARATDVVLNDAGMAALVAAAPGHVTKVRELVFDPLTEKQIDGLIRLSDAWLDVLDPERKMVRSAEAWPDKESCS